MDYDKNSFLSGLAVGRTLKGWAGGSAGINASGAAITLADFVPAVRTFSSLAPVEPSISITLADYLEE